MKYFINTYNTIEDIKHDFLKFAKKLHPDAGGTDAEFREMMNEYEQLSKIYYNKHYNKDGKIYTSTTDVYSGVFADIIKTIIKYNDINIKIIGRWLWVDGNTKPKKNELKALKMRYSGNKQAWYYHEGRYYKGNNTFYSFEDLEEAFGVHNLKTQAKLTA